MGKYKQGILGAFTGKVGSVVGSSWRGKSYMRAIPASVANPRTPGQVNQRNKFTAVAQFLQPNAAFVEIGFKAYAQGQTGRNAASSYLLANAITGTAPDFSVDPALALLSRGRLQKAVNSGASYAANAISVDWDDNSGQYNARPDDEALLVAYNPDKRESVMLLEGVTREDASGALSIPDHFQGDTVEVYLAFRAADGKMVSDSVHVGSVNVV